MVKKYDSYFNRLDEINKDLDKKSVFDSIDRPIRNLVYHMNRIGLRTRFSCCGFNYDGEEEPKSHYNGAYVQFHQPNNVKKELSVFFRFMNHAHSAGWQTFQCNNRLWAVRTVNRLPDDYQKRDGIDVSIHDYEQIVLDIKRLEDSLSYFKPMNNDYFVIVDGNKDVRKYACEWQVVPKKDAVFYVKEVNNSEKRK